MVVGKSFKKEKEKNTFWCVGESQSGSCCVVELWSRWHTAAHRSSASRSADRRGKTDGGILHGGKPREQRGGTGLASRISAQRSNHVRGRKDLTGGWWGAGSEKKKISRDVSFPLRYWRLMVTVRLETTQGIKPLSVSLFMASGNGHIETHRAFFHRHTVPLTRSLLQKRTLWEELLTEIRTVAR